MDGNSDNLIVVVHTGYRPYLEPCLRNAVKSVSGGKVVLLGDEANSGLGICEHASIHDESLQQGIAEFRSVYQHISSSQGFDFERFCIERWFYIRNYLRREGRSNCLAIDSDVLLFCDLTEERQRFAQYAMTFSPWGTVRYLPHCNFIQDLAALEDFCSYVMQTYKSPRLLEELKQANHKKLQQYWISDMSFFYAWAARGNYAVGNLDETLSQGVGFDSSIDNTEQFRAGGYYPKLLRQWKKIRFNRGTPYALERKTRQSISMKCLHYHGPYKLLMEKHSRGESDGWGTATQLLKQKFGRWPHKFSLFYKNYIAARFAPSNSSAPVMSLISATSK